VSDRLAVILASGDPRVLEMGLLYTRNAVKNEWMAEVRLYLFGPSEVVAATDPGLHDLLKGVLDEGVTPVACKYCSDKYSVSERLAELGCEIEYVGQPISEAIRQGYTPMVW